MTNLQNIAKRFHNPNLQALFITCFTELADRAIADGKNEKEANRIAFNILIKEGGFEQIVNQFK